MILLIFLCLLVSLIFAGTEAGLLSLNRVRLRHRARMKDRAARRLERMLREPERLLLTVVIVTNLMNIFAVTLAVSLLLEDWGHWAYLIALGVFTPICIFGTDLLPKAVFRRFPYKMLDRLATPVRVTMVTLNPLLSFGLKLARRMVPDGEGRSGKLFAAREDFMYFTIESERTGALSAQERRMIHQVVDFRSLEAKDLLSPLTSLPTISHESTVDALVKASRGGREGVFLAVNPAGELIGLIQLFDALLDRSSRSRVSAFIRPLTSVPPEESASRLLRRLRSSRSRILLVEGEGRPLGLIFEETLYRRMMMPPEHPGEPSGEQSA